jgi:hypothetical protein
MTEHKCDTPDKCRIQEGMRMSTMVYYQPIYDGYGNNLNPDRNTTTTGMRCGACGKEWTEHSGAQVSQPFFRRGEPTGEMRYNIDPQTGKATKIL